MRVRQHALGTAQRAFINWLASRCPETLKLLDVHDQLAQINIGRLIAQ